jgi:8-oxo-dGTP diphosphatase
MPPVRFDRFPKPAKGSTIVFPVRREGGKVVEVLLAMKKRGFGAGWWNGAGGKLHDGETFAQAAARETAEEIGIVPTRLDKVMEVSFFFPHKPAWDQTTHVFLCDAWTGEPAESEEMKPAWFAVADVPFGQMWPSDDLWIPRVLAGEILESQITFDENNAAVEADIRRADEA